MCYCTWCNRSSTSNCTRIYTASLGEDLARGTISDVLDGCSNDEEVNGDKASAEIVDQDSTDTTATVYSNQEEDQTVTQDDTVIFGDNTADLDEANAAVPIAISIDVDVDEEEEVPPEYLPGFTLNNATDQCERTVSQAPQCTAGFTFDAVTDECEQRQTQAPT